MLTSRNSTFKQTYQIVNLRRWWELISDKIVIWSHMWQTRAASNYSQNNWY